MKIVRNLDTETWQKFVETQPDGNIFHTPEMFQVFKETDGYYPEIWAAVNKNEQVLALLLPVQITLWNGLLRGWSTRAVAYGSLLCAPSAEGQQALDILLQSYTKETKGAFLFTELRNLSDLDSVQTILKRCGFTHEDHLNFLIDLARPQEEIWKNIRSNARRNIKKARKSQVVIEEMNASEQIVTIHALLEEVYKRIQVPLANASLFQAAFDVLHPQGMLKVLVAKVDGVNIGALMLLLYKDVIYYWYTGTLREYASYRAGDLLVWHALEWGNQKDYTVFDFGGAGKPDEEYGVRDFKAKFGGTLVNYGRNLYVHAPLKLKLSQMGYDVYRRLL